MLVDMRTQGFALMGAVQRHVERRVRAALRAASGGIRGVTVAWSDVNGPRGGRDLHCAVTLELIPRGSVRGEAIDGDMFTALTRALARARRSAHGGPHRGRRGRHERSTIRSPEPRA